MKFKTRMVMLALAGTVAAGGLAGCSLFGSSEPKETEAATEVASETETGSTGAKESSSSSSSAKTPVLSKGSTELDADEMGSAAGAADELNSGNAQYLKGRANMDVTSELREELVNGQKPHTVVITCSDSRVPPELIFNADLGELFTIRTAGNVVGDYEVGSVEYAADHLGSQLILVMGHSSCGAVGAAVEGHASGNVEAIVHEITPSVEEAKKETSDEDEVAELAEDLNVANTIKRLRESEVLKELEESGKIKIIGAKYDIETGEVTYFEEDSDSTSSKKKTSSKETEESDETDETTEEDSKSSYDEDETTESEE